MEKMKRVDIDGLCSVCARKGQKFASPIVADAGPWVCDDCAKCVEAYLEMTGYILAIPVFPS